MADNAVVSAFRNRLAKNAKQRFKWAGREGLTAFRLYDLDMPEAPFAVDWYGGFVVLMEYPRRSQRRDGSLEVLREEVMQGVMDVLQLPREKIFFKTHEPMPWGKEQYGRAGKQSVTTVVEEHGLKFEVNLSDFLDVGLFLDHRDTRARVREEVKGKRFLNLFAYTGSFTVYALAGGAKETTTVDLSPQYCAWAERNFGLNGFKVSAQHQIICGDVLKWLEAASGPYDVVVLDPPSFSASKKMERNFNVQKDHRWVVEGVRSMLAPGGALYFSTNFLGFELDEGLEQVGEELTPDSIPEDFRRTVHRCWRFGA
jgi:23S rRNA (cytosine1962-C5)-methyltransferase